MPHGVLFRGGSEKDIRTQLVENNNIETIIGLPSNYFYGTGISTIIMVLKKHREASDILIVDASKEFFKDGNKNRLSGHHIKKIVDAVLNIENIPHFASLVSKQTIKDNDYNLNIPRYVESEEKVPVDLHATVFAESRIMRLSISKNIGKLFRHYAMSCLHALMNTPQNYPAIQLLMLSNKMLMLLHLKRITKKLSKRLKISSMNF